MPYDTKYHIEYNFLCACGVLGFCDCQACVCISKQIRCALGFRTLWPTADGNSTADPWGEYAFLAFLCLSVGFKFVAFMFACILGFLVRATSHTGPRARDQYTSSTLIGGKGRAGPSSLYTTLEGPTEYVNARWMSSLHGFLHDIKWIMFHGHLDYFKNHLLEVGLTQNWEAMALWMLTTVDLFYLSCVRIRMNRNLLN
jgi:hypothetical protein